MCPINNNSKVIFTGRDFPINKKSDSTNKNNAVFFLHIPHGACLKTSVEALHCPLNHSRGATGQLLLRAVIGWCHLWIEQSACLISSYAPLISQFSCGLPVSSNVWPFALLLCYVTVSVNIPVDLCVLLSLLYVLQCYLFLHCHVSLFFLPRSLFNQEIVSNWFFQTGHDTYPKRDLRCGLLSCASADLLYQHTVVPWTAWPNSMTCGSADWVSATVGLICGEKEKLYILAAPLLTFVYCITFVIW